MYYYGGERHCAPSSSVLRKRVESTNFLKFKEKKEREGKDAANVFSDWWVQVEQRP